MSKYRIIKASWVLDSLKAKKILPVAPYLCKGGDEGAVAASQLPTKEHERPPPRPDTTVEEPSPPKPKKAKVSNNSHESPISELFAGRFVEIRVCAVWYSIEQ